jgi:hypothetical protein
MHKPMSKQTKGELLAALRALPTGHPAGEDEGSGRVRGGGRVPAQACDPSADHGPPRKG